MGSHFRKFDRVGMEGVKCKKELHIRVPSKESSIYVGMLEVLPSEQFSPGKALSLSYGLVLIILIGLVVSSLFPVVASPSLSCYRSLKSRATLP